MGYYLLSDSVRGRGIGSTALALMVGFAQHDSDLERLVVMTGSTNTPSIRIAEKNGFVHFRTDPRPGRLDGADLVFFELSLSERR